MIWLTTLLAPFLGGAIQTVTGFGAGIVMMLFFPHFLGYVVAPGLNCLITLFLNLGLAIRYRRHIHFKRCLLLSILFLIVNTTIIRNVKSIDLNFLAIGFALFLILLSVYFLFIEKRMTFRLSIPLILSFTLISGVFSGLFGTGGPLMAVIFLQLTDTREDYIADSQFFFTLSNIATTVTRISNGLFTAELLPLIPIGVCGILLGRLLGGRIADKLNQQLIRKLVYIFVGVCGVITLIQKL